MCIAAAQSQLIYVKSAGRAVDQRNAHEQDTGRERSHEEVLQGGLVAFQVLFIRACQDILRNGNDLDGEEQHQEVTEAGSQHDTRQDEEYERKIICYMFAYLFKFAARQHEVQQSSAQDHCIEQDTEPAYFDHIVQCMAARLHRTDLQQVGHE